MPAAAEGPSTGRFANHQRLSRPLAMPAPPVANAPRFRFIASQADLPAVEVARFTGRERLSAPYTFRIVLVTDGEEMDAGRVVGHRATLRIHREGGDVPIPGIVTHLERWGKTTDHVWYAATLRPRLWRLTLTTQSRVFREATVQKIVATVCAEHGLAAPDVRFELSASHPPRAYCVQYRETDLQFVRRLLEAEGIAFFFVHEADRDVLVVTDRQQAYPSLPAPDALVYREGAGMQRSRLEHVQAFTCRKTLHASRVVLDDTDPQQSETDLQVDARIAGEPEAEIYDHEAHYNRVDVGRRLARVRAEAEAARGIRFSGQSDCPALRPGYCFRLEGHDREDYRQVYLATRVEHVGSQEQAVGVSGEAPVPTMSGPRPPSGPPHPNGRRSNERGSDERGSDERRSDGLHPDGLRSEAVPEDPPSVYRNTFRCLPAQIRFRPRRCTPVPSVGGVLTARVETTGGPYAPLDDDGRYRVRMPFDRSDRGAGTASKPIRMAGPSTGPDYGLHFPNHADTEMVIAFVNGDVDRPLALGTVPNRTQRSPVRAENRMQNVLRTYAGNELLMDDTDEAARVRLRSAASHELHLDDEQRQAGLRTGDGCAIRLDDARKQAVIEMPGGHHLHLNEEQERIDLASASGHRIRISDADDRIVIRDAEGAHVLTLDYAAETMRLSTRGRIALEADDAVEIRGRTVVIEAEEDVALQAGESITQQAGRDVRLEAAEEAAVTAGRDASVEAGRDASVTAVQLRLEGRRTLNAEAGREAHLRGADVHIEGRTAADIRAALLSLNA